MNLDQSRIIKAANRLVVVSKSLDCNPNKEKSGGILTIQLDGFSERYLLDIGVSPSEKKINIKDYPKKKLVGFMLTG